MSTNATTSLSMSNHIVYKNNKLYTISVYYYLPTPDVFCWKLLLKIGDILKDEYYEHCEHFEYIEERNCIKNISSYAHYINHLIKNLTSELYDICIMDNYLQLTTTFTPKNVARDNNNITCKLIFNCKKCLEFKPSKRFTAFNHSIVKKCLINATNYQYNSADKYVKTYYIGNYIIFLHSHYDNKNHILYIKLLDKPTKIWYTSLMYVNESKTAIDNYNNGLQDKRTLIILEGTNMQLLIYENNYKNHVDLVLTKEPFGETFQDYNLITDNDLTLYNALKSETIKLFMPSDIIETLNLLPNKSDKV